MTEPEGSPRDPIPVPTFTGPRPLLRLMRAVLQPLLVGDLSAAARAVDALDDARRGRLDALTPPPKQPDEDEAEESTEPPPDSPELALERKEGLRLAMSARLLVDLVAAGWGLEEELGRLYLIPLSQAQASGDAALLAAKARIRQTMEARVRAGLRSPRVGALVNLAEPRVAALMADPQALAAALAADGPTAVQPYLQPARIADGPDATTGLPLYVVFVYMRWWWSFPYSDSPGRSVPFLIRDAGQPGHPVCGLLCLASPVLRMTQRDSALGLSTRWLKAMVAALNAAVCGPQALDQLAGTLGRGPGPGRGTLWGQVAAALDVTELDRWARRTTEAERAAAAELAAARLLDGLIDEINLAEALVDTSGLRIDPTAPLDAQIAALRQRGDTAERLWRQLRKVVTVDPKQQAAVATLAAELRGQRPDRSLDARDALFVKKRHRQLARLWEARALLEALRSRGAPLAQLAAVLQAHELFGPAPAKRRRGEGPTVGELKTDGQALGVAMEERRVRVLAAQVAEVTVCGAVPPYNQLLGGKLAAIAALSREVAATWRDAYGAVVSEITTRMAGRPVVRDADLLALTTTGFYGVGNAQYNRAAFPWRGASWGWREAGLTAGHGTLHLSDSAAELARALLIAERGGKLINSQFGEGPSERLRTLRDAINLLGLPADDLLQHGSPRAIFVAPLDSAPPYKKQTGSWAESAPSMEELGELWRRRWLSGRLDRAAAELRDLPRPALLSERYPAEVAAAVAAHLGDERLPDDQPEPALEELIDELDEADVEEEA